jgi:hypothetical protein
VLLIAASVVLLELSCGSDPSSNDGSGGAATGGSGATAAGGSATGGSATGGSATGGATTGGANGSTGGNATMDPACAEADSNGFFSDCTVCIDQANCDDINGRRACGCSGGSGCPCGFKCGSAQIAPNVFVAELCVP